MDTSYDFIKLGKLLQSLYVITGQKTTLKGTDFNDIITSNKPCEFCSLIQNTSAGYERCMECDRIALRHVSETNEPHIYRCHAGLLEIAIPIKENGDLFAFLIFGQLLDDSSKEEQWQETEKTIGWHSNHDELKKAFDKIKQFSYEEITSYSEILSACATYIWLKEYVKQHYYSDSEKLKNYLEKNYHRTLKLETVCAELGMGRTKLCGLARHEFNSSIHQLIKEERIKSAAYLLINSNMTIKQISQRVGMDDNNYFVKVFTKKMGVTPSKYRQINKNNNNIISWKQQLLVVSNDFSKKY